jgi:L-alanine-DL-glutamate epimerase-like enolase superfamily enzyme
MKVDTFECWRERVPLLRPYTIAYERVDAAELAFVRLCSGRHQGLGSASPVAEVTGESFAACWAALATAGDAVRAGAALPPAFAQCPAAAAAIDMARCDLRARAAGVPLVELLGAVHTAMPTSITIGIKDSAAAVLAEAAEYLGRGFRCLKVKIGLDLGDDLDRLRQLRAFCGPGVRLRIDANQGYRPDELPALFAAVDALDLEFVEQPLPPATDAELRSLTAGQRARLALDESVQSPADAARLAAPPLAGIFNVKLMKCGGVTPALAIAATAQAHGVALMWGCNDESRIGIAAALHAAFASRATKYLDLDGHLDLAADPAAGGFTLEDGMMRLTGGPGLGVELRTAR